MFAATTRRNSGFSLIELVIVVVIIGIIAAIAIPRMSRGAAGAADGALTADLATLRNAIDLYQTEHGGTFPDIVADVDCLLKYTDDAGTVNATKTGNFIYGPYLREIPPLPVGGASNKGQKGVTAAYAANKGWIYVKATGVITACCQTEADASGKLYTAY